MQGLGMLQQDIMKLIGQPGQVMNPMFWKGAGKSAMAAGSDLTGTAGFLSKTLGLGPAAAAGISAPGLLQLAGQGKGAMPAAKVQPDKKVNRLASFREKRMGKFDDLYNRFMLGSQLGLYG